MKQSSAIFSLSTSGRTFSVRSSSPTHELVNYVRVLKTPLSPSKLVPKPLHLAIAHPPSLSNRFQFTEGVAMLSYVATHLSDFPLVPPIFHLNLRSSTSCCWARTRSAPSASTPCSSARCSRSSPRRAPSTGSTRPPLSSLRTTSATA